MSANEPHPSAVGEGLRGEGPVFGFRDGRTASRGQSHGRMRGRESVSGGDKGGEFVECVEGGKKGRH